MGDKIDAHLAWLAAMGRTEHTMRSRASVLSKFAEFMAPRSILEATEDDCVLWLNSGGWSRPTKRTYHANLSAFFTWAVRREHITRSPLRDMRKPTIPQRPPRPVPDDEFQAALAIATPRTRVWLVLARYCGLRAAEVAAIRPEDVQWEDGLLTVHGKGQREAIIPLHPLAQDELQRWVEAHDGQTWEVLPTDVSKAGSYALRRAGSSHTFHSCRHGFAMHLLDQYDDVALVSRALRHASLATTQVYAQTRDARLWRAVREMGSEAS